MREAEGEESKKPEPQRRRRGESVVGHDWSVSYAVSAVSALYSLTQTAGVTDKPRRRCSPPPLPIFSAEAAAEELPGTSLSWVHS